MYWNSDAFFLPDSRLRAQIPPNSLRVGPQVRNFKKDCNYGYVTQLSIRQ